MTTRSLAIISSFETLPDPRREAGNHRHRLVDMIFVALCGSIANCDSWADIEQFANERIEWLRQYVPLEKGIPSHDTFSRVFAALDTSLFAACLQDWIEKLHLELTGQGVHIDGKTLRRSFDAATNRQALHVVSAWVNDLNICLGQVATCEKSNEITAVPMLLDLLNIKGAVVTLDAMNCQTKIAAKIRDREADYILTVKANQKGLQKLLRETFIDLEDNASNRIRSQRTFKKTKGRREERCVHVAAAPRELKQSGKWADIKTIGMVYRHRQSDPTSQSMKAIRESEHVTFFISSLPPKVKTIAKHVHERWSVENSLHWSLDVTFSEDASRIRKGNGAEVMSHFRRLALSILKRDTSLPKKSLRLKRLITSWSQKALDSIVQAI